MHTQQESALKLSDQHLHEIGMELTKTVARKSVLICKVSGLSQQCQLVGGRSTWCLEQCEKQHCECHEQHHEQQKHDEVQEVHCDEIHEQHHE